MIIIEYIHITVHGRVQGVGFRQYTKKQADRLGITGTVENVSDYVEIYTDRNCHRIDEFLTSVKKGPSPLSKVNDIKIEHGETNDYFTSFDII